MRRVGAASELQVEEGPHRGPYGRHRPVGGDRAGLQLLPHHHRDLGRDGHEVRVGVVVGVREPQAAAPAAQSLPERVPGRVLVHAVVHGCVHQQERPVETVLDHRPVQRAVQVDAGPHPLVPVHDGRRRGTAPGVPEGAGPREVQAPAQTAGQRAPLCVGIAAPVHHGQLVEHEPQVVGAHRDRLRPAGRIRLGAGYDAAVGELHLARVVRVVHRDHHVPPGHQVLDDEGVERAVRGVARRVQQHRPAARSGRRPVRAVRPRQRVAVHRAAEAGLHRPLGTGRQPRQWRVTTYVGGRVVHGHHQLTRLSRVRPGFGPRPVDQVQFHGAHRRGPGRSGQPDGDEAGR